jgi:hypothetical protein
MSTNTDMTHFAHQLPSTPLMNLECIVFISSGLKQPRMQPKGRGSSACAKPPTSLSI